MRLCSLPLSFLLFLLATPSWASSLRITTIAVPNGTVGSPYSASVQASGACTPYKWAITSGTLPPGVAATPSSNTTSLNFNGTPTTANAYPFKVQVTACGHRSATASYDVVIQASPNHVVDLSWNPSTTTDVTGCNVYRGPDGVNWVKINVSLVTSTTYSDSTMANSSTYYYAATAVDVYGKESTKTPAIKVGIP